MQRIRRTATILCLWKSEATLGKKIKSVGENVSRTDLSFGKILDLLCPSFIVKRSTMVDVIGTVPIKSNNKWIFSCKSVLKLTLFIPLRRCGWVKYLFFGRGIFSPSILFTNYNELHSTVKKVWRTDLDHFGNIKIRLSAVTSVTRLDYF